MEIILIKKIFEANILTIIYRHQKEAPGGDTLSRYTGENLRKR